MDEKLYSYFVILFAAAAIFYCFVALCSKAGEVKKLKKKYPAEGEIGKYIKKQSVKCIWLVAAMMVLAVVAVYFKVKF